MGAISRRGETEEFKKYFETKPSIISSKKIVIMTENDGTIDGGDVLYVPDSKDIFVGLSKRTNEKGIEFLKKTFPNCNVIPIQVKK